MRVRTGGIVLLLLMLPGNAAELAAQDEWDRAAREVRRLAPSAFPDLPDAVRTGLEAAACRIPQLWDRREPHNVIRGRFAAPDQEDWAALCSREGTTVLFVFWGGPARCASETGASPDRDWLQGVGRGRIGYSRSIRPVGEGFIGRMHEAFGGREPPPITHEGVAQSFVGKASRVLYCHEGEWLVLTGMD